MHMVVLSEFFLQSCFQRLPSGNLVPATVWTPKIKWFDPWFLIPWSIQCSMRWDKTKTKTIHLEFKPLTVRITKQLCFSTLPHGWVTLPTAPNAVSKVAIIVLVCVCTWLSLKFWMITAKNLPFEHLPFYFEPQNSELCNSLSRIISIITSYLATCSSLPREVSDFSVFTAETPK